jgi:hypothetical protein
MIVNDAPMVFLYFQTDYRFVQTWVRGFRMHPVWSVRFEHLWLERP